MWEVIGKGREPVAFEQDYFPERDIGGVSNIHYVWERVGMWKT
jgi:hypothetical protein